MAEMQWTHSALDTLIAPHLSRLTACGAEELPAREKLLPEFILTAIFTVNYGDQQKKNVLNLIRHVDHAALAYDAGRACVINYVSDKPGKQVSAYFNAVSHFETHVAHLNMARRLAMHAANPSQKKLHQKGSGCFDDQLRRLNNGVKHLAERIANGRLPEGHTVSLWLTNDGLEGDDAAVTFPDLVGSLMDCYGVARRLTQECLN